MFRNPLIFSQLCVVAKKTHPPGIALAMDMVTFLEGLVTHLGRRRAVEFHMVISAQSFQHGIEALTRPRS